MTLVPLRKYKNTTDKLLGQVVRRLGNHIHRINHYPVDSVVCLLTLVNWIVIYPADSVNQSPNNRGQEYECVNYKKWT